MIWIMRICSVTLHPHPIKIMTVVQKMVLNITGLLLITVACYGQPPADQGLHGLFEIRDTIRHDFASPLRVADNDISVVASAGFLLYKAFISSQDNPSCVFTPSCSEYAVEAIQQYGFFLGWLKTFDRLSRCHGLVNHQHYHIDIEKKRFYDPVQ